MSISKGVASQQRFNAANPCPICGGHPSLPHGQGVRCTGFRSAAPNYVHCTREEFANGIPRNVKTTPPTYVHHLVDWCRCGVRHDLGKVKAVYHYNDNGTLVQQIVRYEPKDFRPRTPRPDGGWRNKFPERRVLYNLDAIRAAGADAWVLYPEGEKDVETCTAHDLIATTHAQGANGWRPEFATELKGKKVAILPHNDPDSRAMVSKMTADLDGVVRVLKVVDLPGLAEHGDVTDWFAAGGTKDELLKLIEAAPEGSTWLTGPGLSSNVHTASLELNYGLLVMSGPELLAGSAQLHDLPFLPLLSIEGYFVKGWSHLVSGYPRVGKTDLLLACCRQWLRMGERVLYITEEPVTIWQHRLKMWSGDWTNLQVAFGLGADPGLLRKLAREGAATLVVVDALRNLLQLKDEKDNSEIARVVNPWVADARLAEKTLVLAHHQRKGGGEHGEGISGGHALMGAFDIPIEVLWDPSKGTNRRLVRTYPRLIEAKEGLYEKVADGEFEYVGDPQALALFEVTDKARLLLTDVWQTTDEIWAGIDEPKPSKEQVRKALTELAKQKVALRDPSIDSGPARGKTHRWRRPDTGSSEASATGSELSSNDTVYTLEPNSDSALSSLDPDSEEVKAAFAAENKRKRKGMFK